MAGRGIVEYFNVWHYFVCFLNMYYTSIKKLKHIFWILEIEEPQPKIKINGTVSPINMHCKVANSFYVVRRKKSYKTQNMCIEMDT